ncbi:MAG: hypothetical protein WDN28_12405 [Chthoniobacter sp.]
MVAPGKPGDSELISRIFSTDKDEVMPTPKSNRTPDRRAAHAAQEMGRAGRTVGGALGLHRAEESRNPEARSRARHRAQRDRLLRARPSRRGKI